MPPYKYILFFFVLIAHRIYGMELLSFEPKTSSKQEIHVATTVQPSFFSQLWHICKKPFVQLSAYIQSYYLNQNFAQATREHLVATTPEKQQQSLEKVKALLDQKADPETPVRIPYPAPLKGTDDFEANRGIFTTYSPPLYAATYGNAEKLVHLLIQHKADVNSGVGIKTPLQVAVWHNKTNIGMCLLENGCNPNKFPYYEGTTTPHLTRAVGIHGNVQLTRELLKKGTFFALPAHNLPVTIGDEIFLRAILRDEYDAHHRQKNDEYRNDVQKFLTSSDNNHPHLPAALGDTIVSYLPPLYRYTLPDNLPTEEQERIKAISHMLSGELFPLQRPPSAHER